MAEKRKREPDDEKQSARFREDARRLGVDERGTSFEQAISALAKGSAAAKLAQRVRLSRKEPKGQKLLRVAQRKRAKGLP